jgi:ABC-type multidrug transport system fused ATPase/permease subunit
MAAATALEGHVQAMSDVAYSTSSKRPDVGAHSSMTMLVSSAALGWARRALSLIDGRLRRRLMAAVLVTLVVSVLEIACVVAVFPLFQLMLDPERLTHSYWFQRFFGAVPRTQLLVWACAATLTLFLVKTVAAFYGTWFKYRLQSQVSQHLAGKLFRLYLASPVSFHAHQRPTDLLRNTVFYVAQTSQAGVIGLVDLCSDSILCLGIFVSLAVVQPWISLLALVLIVVLAMIYINVGQPYFLRWGRRYNASYGKLSKTVVEAVVGIKTLKVLGIERYFEHEFETQFAEYCNIGSRNLFAASVPRQILELATVTSIVGAIIWAVASGANPAVIMPVLVLFSAAVYRMMPAMIRMTSVLQSIRVAQDAIETLYLQLSTDALPTPKRAVAAKPGSSEITLNEATFFYENATRPALDHVTLTIHPGEVVGFVGPSGAGKSSLADVILGLHKLTAGSLSIGAVEYNDPGTMPSGMFGYVPQDPFLIDDTLRRNIALGIPDRDIDEDRLRAAIRIAALESFVAGAPAGLDTIVGDRGVRLSGGQRQRIGIARAMYRDPAILVLDEATSAVDATTEAEISNAINKLRGQKTVIVVAHRLSTVRECDQVFYLKDGRIVDRGRFDDLVAKNEDFAATVRQIGIVSRTTVAEPTV